MIVFLIGLAFAGFHLLFAYSAGIWSARETIEQQLADLEKELDKTSANALQKYVIDSDLTSTASKLKSMIADMQEIKKQDPPLDTAKVRKYSETMIVLSYAAFFLGALVVIYRA